MSIRAQVAALRRKFGQDGNAVLFSLLILGSALVTSSGMATLVTNEISSVSLIPPSERAYYKAESYIEQGLWQKKEDPHYQIKDKSQLPANFLCVGNCFMTNPQNQVGSLISYASTTSIPDEDLVLKQDKVVQVDIDTSAATGATGSFDLGSIKSATGLRGVEVTVIAYPKSAPFNNISGTTTPVLIDTKLFRPSDALLSVSLGPPNVNKIGEPYPALNTSFYRIRLKALGADTVVKPTAIANPNTSLLLLMTDFRAQAVAEDGEARRGIEVLVPAAEQISSIFDFVIFSDLTLAKTDAKAQGTKLIKATVYDDNNGNCTQDAGDTPLSNLPVTADPGYSTSTDVNGIASFPDVQPLDYTVRATLSVGMTACSNNARVSFTDDDSTEVREVALLVRSPQRVPLYRFWSAFYGDHFYTVAPCQRSAAVPACNGNDYVQGVDYFGGGWRYEFIQTFVYNIQVPGTQPLYRMWHGGIGDHFYTMSLAEYNAVWWYTKEGPEAYLIPVGASGLCPSGTIPFHRTYSYSSTDHFYATNLGDAVSSGWATYEGVAGCSWPTQR
jgi:uncharacterized protein DUF5648